MDRRRDSPSTAVDGRVAQGNTEAVRRYRGQRGPQKSPTKELVSLRIDHDIVEAYRATGSGWQKRANEALRVYAKKSGFTEK